MNRRWDLRLARPDELAELADLAARCQRDPDRYCSYVGDDTHTIAADVDDVDDWAATTVVADDGDRPIGWLLAESDDEIGRTWWWGPFVDRDTDWDQVADALWEHAQAAFGDEIPSTSELAADSRSSLVAAFADRHGFDANEGSACLVLHAERDDDHAQLDRVLASAIETAGVEITTPDAAPWVEAVASLHDRLFARTHRTGADVARSSGDQTCLVALADGDVVGYVATERQHDGSLYVDFLGVDPEHRGRGIGRALVAGACRQGFGGGATFAHLTVRESNHGARALYDALGFETERVLVPYRRGFSFDD